MSRVERLYLRLGPVRIPLVKFRETADSFYVIAPFPRTGLHLSVHGSGEIHLREGGGATSPILARSELPPINAYNVLGWLEEFVEALEPGWIPSSDVFLSPAVTSFPGHLLRRVPGGQEMDVLRFLRSWRGELPFKWVEEGHLEEYTARFGEIHSLVASPDEGLVGLPITARGGGYLALRMDQGGSLGPLGGLLEAFPMGEALESLIEVGMARIEEYEEEGRGFGALFEAHVSEEDLETFGRRVEAALLPLENLQPRWRYPTDWEG